MPFLVLPLLLLALFAVIPVAYAHPKSMYLIANHHTAQFDAWNINPDGTGTYQATYWLSHATDPAGIAIDESSTTLFVTSEFSGGVEMVDATTMTSLGVSSGPQNLAGIDVDDANDDIYAVGRMTNALYVYDWDPVGKTLTPKAGFNPYYLPGCSQALGIDFDGTRGILWVADGGAGVARAYDIMTWIEDATVSFTPSHKPIDIAVDRLRGFVYTTSMYYQVAYVPSGSGSDLISKFDLTTRTETTIDMGHDGVGIAVDEVTGYVYVTGGYYDQSLEVWDPSTGTKLQDTGDIGGPAGICIPREEVAYNPLHLSKDDGVVDCVNPGDTITYTICFDNLLNNYPVTNVVLVDNLPAETDFVSASDGGTYSSGPHTVTWNIGTLPALAPQDCVTLVVTVKSGTTPGITIDNAVTINAAEPGTGPTTVHEYTDICPKHTLTIHSVPTGVTFTVDSMSHTTSWSETYDDGASVNLVMPETHTVGDAKYYWNQWDDGDPSRSRTVIMDADKTLTGEFTGPYYELTVTSLPITGITYTIDGVPKVTSHTEWLLGGSYTLEMPETHNGYVWSHWLEDGDTNRVKTITLPGTTWTGVFVPVPVGGYWVPINKFELLAPWIGLVSVLIPAVAVSVAYAKHRKKQQN